MAILEDYLLLPVEDRLQTKNIVLEQQKSI